MQLDRSTMKKITALILLCFFLLAIVMHPAEMLAGFQFLLGILSPFLIGAALAFVLNVPMRTIERFLFGRCADGSIGKKIARPLSLVITLLLLILLILLLFLVVLPQLGESVSTLGALITSTVPRSLAWLEDTFANNPQIADWIHSISFEWEGILTNVVSFLREGAGSVLTSTISAAKSVINGIVTAFIAFVFSCYILLQKETLGRQARKVVLALLPQVRAERVLSVAAMSHRVFAGFITGQCLEAVILGSMFFVVLSLLRLPYALLIGCLISVTALIPIVGAFIGCAVGAFLLLMVSPSNALLFVILFLVLQQIEGNLIYPHVVGNSVGLPSIWVLAAVSLGGSLFGVSGMLLFIPLLSVAYSLFRDYVNRRLAARQTDPDRPSVP